MCCTNKNASVKEGNKKRQPKVVLKKKKKESVVLFHTNSFMSIKHAHLKKIYLHEYQNMFVIANMSDKYGKNIFIGYPV